MPTILVVDDEPSIRGLLRAALDGNGYRLLDAADGASALQIAQRERPDLILLDIALPGLSGLEVCRRLRANPATAETPVLLLSGIVQAGEQREATKAGAQGVIAKPFSPAALVTQIEDALRRRPTVASR